MGIVSYYVIEYNFEENDDEGYPKDEPYANNGNESPEHELEHELDTDGYHNRGQNLELHPHADPDSESHGNVMLGNAPMQDNIGLEETAYGEDYEGGIHPTSEDTAMANSQRPFADIGNSTYYIIIA